MPIPIGSGTSHGVYVPQTGEIRKPPKPKPSGGGGYRPPPAPAAPRPSYSAPSYSAPSPASYSQGRPAQKLQPFSGSVAARVIEQARDAVQDTVQQMTPQFGATGRLQAFQMLSESGKDMQGRDVKPAESKAETEMREKTYKPKKSFKMSWDDYNALSDRQRAAVDFNTLLVQAREKDLTADYKPTEQQEKTFQKGVEKMFGEDGGTETFAPETLAVLRQIDYDGNMYAGRDMDDFLGLKVAITANDLARLDQSTIPKTATTPVEIVQAITPQTQETQLQQQLADNTAAMRTAMEKGGQMLKGFAASARMTEDRAADLQAFGGTLSKVPLPAGFGQTEKDMAFQKVFDALAFKGNDPIVGQIWSDLEEQVTANGDSMDEFVRYVDDRLNENRYGLDPKQGFRTPEEYRDLLKLGQRTKQKED